MRPAVPGKTDSYDLTYSDGGDDYAFNGTRNTDGNQYVLYFDPSRKAFILDRVDSTFNMSVTRLPDNSDSESLSIQHPHLDTRPKSPPPRQKSPPPRQPAKPAAKDKPAPKPRAKEPAPKKEVKRKTEKKQAPKKSTELSLPVPQPPKPKPKPEPKRRAPVDEEDEDEDDDDGGLLVEYPGADSRPGRQTDFSPAFPAVRRFDDFMNQRESEGDDADGEDDDEGDMDFIKLPSPVNPRIQPPEPMEVDEDEDQGGADLLDDLEDDFEKAFEDLENSQQGTPEDNESEISEED